MRATRIPINADRLFTGNTIPTTPMPSGRQGSALPFFYSLPDTGQTDEDFIPTFGSAGVAGRHWRGRRN